MVPQNSLLTAMALIGMSLVFADPIPLGDATSAEIQKVFENHGIPKGFFAERFYPAKRDPFIVEEIWNLAQSEILVCLRKGLGLQSDPQIILLMDEIDDDKKLGCL